MHSPLRFRLALLPLLLLLHPPTAAVECPTTRVYRNSSNSGPSTLLYSFEGSGNTWLRFLMENATGILTGALYRDPSLFRAGFGGEGTAGRSVLVVKSHLHRTPAVGSPALKQFDNFLLLVRHPLSAFVSERKRRLTGSHLQSPSWTVFQRGCASRQFPDNALNFSAWLQLYAVPRWEATLAHAEAVRKQASIRFAVVRYEDLAANVTAALAPVLAFVGADPAFAACVRDPNGNPSRPRSSAFPPCVYTADQLAHITDSLGPRLAAFGYGGVYPGCPGYVHHE